MFINSSWIYLFHGRILAKLLAQTKQVTFKLFVQHTLRPSLGTLSSAYRPVLGKQHLGREVVSSTDKRSRSVSDKSPNTASVHTKVSVTRRVT